MKGLGIAVVGPCASGKTTLVEALRAMGFEGAYSVPQEHSVAPMLWRVKNPDVLVFLDVSYSAIRRRRPVSWGPDRLELQQNRLSGARSQCDVYLDTSDLTRQEMIDSVTGQVMGRDWKDEHSHPGDSEEGPRGPDIPQER
jgi:GTPase SAR1 family protein